MHADCCSLRSTSAPDTGCQPPQPPRPPQPRAGQLCVSSQGSMCTDSRCRRAKGLDRHDQDLNPGRVGDPGHSCGGGARATASGGPGPWPCGGPGPQSWWRKEATVVGETWAMAAGGNQAIATWGIRVTAARGTCTVAANHRAFVPHFGPHPWWIQGIPGSPSALSHLLLIPLFGNQSSRTRRLGKSRK